MPDYTIEEVPNPAYQKAMKDRKSFVPVKGSIRVTDKEPQPSLAEQIRDREKRHEVTILSNIKKICDCCPEISDCTFAFEMQATDRCYRVKRNLLYYGVIEK